MEYHSFLYFHVVDYCDYFDEFPSPYGVSFILIIKGAMKRYEKNEFPSPYGVSFILICRYNRRMLG